MPVYRGDTYSGCTITGSFVTMSTCGVAVQLQGATGIGGVCVVAYRQNPGDATGFTCSTAGVTLALSCGGRTGWNTWAVNTNSDPTFYSCGHDFELLLTGGRAGVGGVCTTNYLVGAFSLVNRAKLLPVTFGRKLDVTQSGHAGINWANVLNCTNVTALTCTTVYDVVQAAPIATVVDAVWDEQKYADHSTCGTFGFLLDKAISSISAGSGPSANSIACTVWDELKYNNHSTCGSFGFLLDCAVSTRLTSTVPGRTLDVTATGAAGIDWGNVENKTTVNDLTCTSTYQVVRVIDTSNIGTGAAPSINSIACAVWDELKYNNHSTCGSFGFLLDCAVSTRLTSTVPGRTLDVTTGGAAGVDWGNVENKTTVNDLTCTSTYQVVRVTDPSNIGSGSAPSINSIACAVWDELKYNNHSTCGSFGFLLDCAVSTRLTSTVPGRTLDVTTTGGAGIDWANVENPTTALALTCTSIYTADHLVQRPVTDPCSTIYTADHLVQRPVVDACSTIYTADHLVQRPVIDACSTVFTVQKLIDRPIVDASSIVASVSGAVGSVTAGVTVTTNNDKTGYALTQAAYTCIIGQAVITEPANVPGWPMSVCTALGWIAAVASNCVTQTADHQSLCNRAVNVTIASAPITCTTTIVHRGTFGAVIP